MNYTHSPAGAEAPEIAPRCGFCTAILRGRVCKICSTPAGHPGEIPPERRRAVDAYCRSTYMVDFSGLRFFVQASGNLRELAALVAEMPGCQGTDTRYMVATLHTLRRLARPDVRLRRAMQRSGLLP